MAKRLFNRAARYPNDERYSKYTEGNRAVLARYLGQEGYWRQECHTWSDGKFRAQAYRSNGSRKRN